MQFTYDLDSLPFFLLTMNFVSYISRIGFNWINRRAPRSLSACHKNPFTHWLTKYRCFQNGNALFTPNYDFGLSPHRDSTVKSMRIPKAKEKWNSRYVSDICYEADKVLAVSFMVSVFCFMSFWRNGIRSNRNWSYRRGRICFFPLDHCWRWCCISFLRWKSIHLWNLWLKPLLRNGIEKIQANVGLIKI